MLTEHGVLAVIERSAEVALREDDIFPSYSLKWDYVSWNSVNALEEAVMFERQGRQRTGPVLSIAGTGNRAMCEPGEVAGDAGVIRGPPDRMPLLGRRRLPHTLRTRVREAPRPA